ncbi:hypothetical protein B7494_g4172 [Chlorociboria aeruginascens]|nr:hypothetical protein B7494_g4172 [Chlorociboria aeruginascens]
MNDPGLDEPISNRAKDVEEQKDDTDPAEDNELAFLEPNRWWFGSTAFPLVAGAFGPMASAFSICALVGHWREYIPPGGNVLDGVPIEDPKWLIGVNAAQLVIALVANLFLLLNMAKRVKFSYSMAITIIGWYISSCALIGLTACASGPLKLEADNHAFSQAFYYAVFAAGLYCVVASLLVVTVWGAYHGQYAKEFQLTMSQRTLMLQTISFLVYLLSGSAVYSHIEGWKYLDAVYWADVTLLTVGYGELSPTTHLGRGLLFPYAIGGIIYLGLVIGSIRSLVLERGKAKLGARMVEKTRERLLIKMQKEKKAAILEPIKDGKASASQNSEGNTDNLSERQRRHQEFHLMRKIQAAAHRKEQWTSLIISLTTWLVLWLAGAAVFEATESIQGWSYFVSLYFSYISLLTIGFGDFTPISNSGKPFFVFWSLLAVPALTVLISNMGDTIIKGIRDLTLWIGTVTVLPDEKIGPKTALKVSARKIRRNRNLDKATEEPPGILGEMKHGVAANSGKQKYNPESKDQHAEDENAEKEMGEARHRGRQNDELPGNKRDYHVLLIKEIGKVMKHLDSSPPRKYTFEEWAWYLKLVGEDENSADRHRKATKGSNLEKDEGLGSRMKKGNDGEHWANEKWSWVGVRSPLMGNKAEAEWVLEKLTETLERELEALRREDAELRAGESGVRGEREGDELKERSSSKTTTENQE